MNEKWKYISPLPRIFSGIQQPLFHKLVAKERDHMENFDAAKATRVWQRVQGTQPESEGLPALIAGEMEDSATYIQLAKRLGGKEGQTLRRMAETEHSHAACLKGIYTLMTGEPINPRIPPLRQEPAD